MKPSVSWQVNASVMAAASWVLGACSSAGTPTSSATATSPTSTEPFDTSGAPTAEHSAGSAGRATRSAASESLPASSSGQRANTSASRAVAGAGGAGTAESVAAQAGGPGAATGAAGTAATMAAETAAAGNNGSAAISPTPTFSTRILSSDHYAEGAAIDDVNGDGALDLIAGPNWYAGPSFEQGGTIVDDPPKLGMDQYSLFFLTFAADLNGDGRSDVIGVADAGGGNGSGTPNAHWYENPGPDRLGSAWPKHVLFDELVTNESPVFQSVVGDAANELVFMSSGKLGYASMPTDAISAWPFQVISGDASWSGPYIHGLGVGDIDGDGLLDIVERSGYWRQTANPPWERHKYDFWMGSTMGRADNWGGAQMAVFDVDGDGDNDVVSALAAHQYGLAWFEQRPGESPEFVAHEILPTQASEGNVSQLHALVSVDVNGDGLPDIVTGKRYYAHPSSFPDPGSDDPALLLWFELQRDARGAHFVEHIVHDDSGAGCSFAARDVNGDGKVDIFTTNKRGTFLHLQD